MSNLTVDMYSDVFLELVKMLTAAYNLLKV